MSARDIVERLRDQSQTASDYCDSCKCDKDKADAASEIARLRARVAELEVAHAANASGEQPPRGWLTSEERACIEELLPYTFSGVQAKTLTMLLARSTPPRVKAPSKAFIILNGESMVDVRDNAWIAAIREAGGEVQ